MSPFNSQGLSSLVYVYQFLSFFFGEIHISHANGVDPDQTPRLAASDLCLHYLLCPFMGTYALMGHGTQFVFVWCRLCEVKLDCINF